jgi:hypothetical protein
LPSTAIGKPATGAGDSPSDVRFSQPCFTNTLRNPANVACWHAGSFARQLLAVSALRVVGVEAAASALRARACAAGRLATGSAAVPGLESAPP